MIGRRQFLGASISWLAAGTSGAMAQQPQARTRPASSTRTAVVERPVRPDEQVNRVIAAVRDEHHLPGMIGAIIVGDHLAAIGAVGLRKIGSEEPITIHDHAHLGSCTKAMTATVIGLAVEQGKLGWDSTPGDIFKREAESLHADFRKVTLLQLLTHRAGLPHDGRWRGWGRGRSLVEQRRAAAIAMLREAPQHPPGSQFGYSNAGYVIAAAMLEQAAGRSWEALIREELLEPLGMASAGFGAPGTEDLADQPWGHRETDGEVRPTRQDNAPVMAPASSVHVALADWGRFASLHLRAAQGKTRLLKAETFRTLHTPAQKGNYAGGWYVVERDWAGGRALMHKGSNLSWYATIWLAPGRDAAFLVAANQGGDEAEKACDEATESLIRYYTYVQNTTPRRSRTRRR